MYDLIGYGGMISDRVRTASYARALEHTITPETTVLDIGTGTGLFAMLACRFGARHVYAVEPDDAIALARDIARDNGYERRITFIQGRCEDLSLPEPVDVIVSDIRGVLPLYAGSVQTIIDARQRLLAPEGVLIPLRDRLMAAPVDAQDLYDKHASPWMSHPYDLDMRAAQRYAKNTWHKGRIRTEQLLATPGCWAELDYATVDSPHVKGHASWLAQRCGTVHGVSVWFETELAPGAGFSSGPDHPELVYGNAFFPLSEPVAVAEGDRIALAMRADLVGEEYVWSWRTRIQSAESAQDIKAAFDQSSFYGSPMFASERHKRAACHRPSLTEDGQVALTILRLMSERHKLQDIAQQICERFPHRFSDWSAALNHVGRFSGDFSKTPSESRDE